MRVSQNFSTVLGKINADKFKQEHVIRTTMIDVLRFVDFGISCFITPLGVVTQPTEPEAHDEYARRHRVDHAERKRKRRKPKESD